MKVFHVHPHPWLVDHLTLTRAHDFLPGKEVPSRKLVQNTLGWKKWWDPSLLPLVHLEELTSRRIPPISRNKLMWLEQ